MRFLHGMMVTAFGLCAACAPMYSSGDPFAGGAGRSGRGSGHSGVRDYLVRVEVGCDECVIRLAVGPQTMTGLGEWSDQLWSASFSRHPLSPEAIRVTATPAAHSASSVRFVRIFVDGDVVASGECDCDDVETTITNNGRILSAETVIPLRNR